MATKAPSKGSVLQVSISASFTAVSETIDISTSGAGLEFYDSRTLGAGVGLPKDLTGHANGGQVSWSMFWDPADSTHQHLTDSITTPAKESMKLIFADSGTTEWTWTGITSGGPDVNLTGNDGAKASFTQEVDGLIVYAT